jgi:hypothetical protein
VSSGGKAGVKEERWWVVGEIFNVAWGAYMYVNDGEGKWTLRLLEKHELLCRVHELGLCSPFNVGTENQTRNNNLIK